MTTAGLHTHFGRTPIGADQYAQHHRALLTCAQCGRRIGWRWRTQILQLTRFDRAAGCGGRGRTFCCDVGDRRGNGKHRAIDHWLLRDHCGLHRHRQRFGRWMRFRRECYVDWKNNRWRRGDADRQEPALFGGGLLGNRALRAESTTIRPPVGAMPRPCSSPERARCRYQGDGKKPAIACEPSSTSRTELRKGPARPGRTSPSGSPGLPQRWWPHKRHARLRGCTVPLRRHPLSSRCWAMQRGRACPDAWVSGNPPRKQNAQPKLGVDVRKSQPLQSWGNDADGRRQ